MVCGGAGGAPGPLPGWVTWVSLILPTTPLESKGMVLNQVTLLNQVREARVGS